MQNTKLESVYYLLGKVIGIHYYRTHKLLEKQGVYPGQPPLLFALYKEDGQSQKELAQKLGIQPATITMMVKRMTKAGLIERRQDEKDQRISRVYLTDEGKEVHSKVKEIVKKIGEECFGSFSEEELDNLSSLLTKITKNLLPMCDGKFSNFK